MKDSWQRDILWSIRVYEIYINIYTKCNEKCHILGHESVHNTGQLQPEIKNVYTIIFTTFQNKYVLVATQNVLKLEKKGWNISFCHTIWLHI